MKDAAEKVYFTGTQFFSASPMAAAIATLKELKKLDAANKMTEFGQRLNESLVKVAKESGYELVASGVPAMPYYRLNDVDVKTHFRWIDECVRRGVYMLGYHNHFVSTCHTEEDIEAISSIAKQAFEVLEDNTK